jgi:hypothetical protein
MKLFMFNIEYLRNAIESMSRSSAGGLQKKDCKKLPTYQQVLRVRHNDHHLWLSASDGVFAIPRKGRHRVPAKRFGTSGRWTLTPVWSRSAADR